jgi:hypothetical protein
METAPRDGSMILALRKPRLTGPQPKSPLVVIRRIDDNGTWGWWKGVGNFAAQDEDLVGWWPLPEQTR